LVVCYHKAMRILFFGDSITQGFWSKEGGWVEIIRRYFDGLAIQNLKNNHQPEVFNLGVSGDTTRNLLARIEQETRVRIWPEDPITVVISIGTNDDLFEGDKQWVPPEEFKINLKKIIELVQPHALNIVLVGNIAVDERRTTPVSWGDFSYTNKELERSERVIEEVSKLYNLPYVPIYSQFKTELDKGSNLLADGLHPNAAGHKLIAEQVLRILIDILGSSSKQ
jgi:lysophospholipase L1-like esterase